MYSVLARWCYRHPWKVLAAWLCVVIAVAAPSVLLGASYSGTLSFGDTESSRGADVIEAHFGSLSALIGGTLVFRVEQGVQDPTVRDAVVGLLAEFDAVEGVDVVSPYDPGGGRLIAHDGPEAGRVAYAEIAMTDWQDLIADDAEHLIDESGLRSMPGVQIELGGNAFSRGKPPESEAIGLAFAMFALIAALGSVMAMGITIGAALVVVGIASAGVTVLSNFATVPEFAPVLAVMIGLGVGIDYALFVITRYQEQTGRGMAPEDAIAAALDSAGRSVVFAGATVSVSMLGLVFMGVPMITGLGLATAAAVVVVMIGSITILPATVGLFS